MCGFVGQCFAPRQSIVSAATLSLCFPAIVSFWFGRMVSTEYLLCWFSLRRLCQTVLQLHLSKTLCGRSPVSEHIGICADESKPESLRMIVLRRAPHKR